MAGYSVLNQTFALCNNVSVGLLVEPVSGLLGLAFQAIAASKAMPLWQTLVMSGVWESPLMGFHLTRLVDSSIMRLEFLFSFFFFFDRLPLSFVPSYINSTFAPSEVPGGSFSMGKIYLYISQLTSFTSPN